MLDRPATSLAPSAAKQQPHDVDIYVGSKIRIRRGQLGMSQASLGGRVDLTFQQIQKYEKGINRVGASRLAEIARALEVPVSFFFPGDASVPIPRPDQARSRLRDLKDQVARLVIDLETVERDLGL